MSTRRCGICALNLPNDEAWQNCPRCGEPTNVFTNAEPTLSEEEATQILRLREFEEYLGARDA